MRECMQAQSSWRRHLQASSRWWAVVGGGGTDAFETDESKRDDAWERAKHNGANRAEGCDGCDGRDGCDVTGSTSYAPEMTGAPFGLRARA